MHSSTFKYLLIVSLCLSICGLFAQNISETKRVLYINSYSPTYAWSDSITKGITHTFLARQDVDLSVEYLDSKRYGKTLFKQYYNLIKNKYQNHNIQALITSDNNALDFVLNYPELFPNIPVIYCGVNNPQSYPLENIPFYGIKEGEYHEAMIETILKILPNTETLYYIHDSTKTSLVNTNIIKELEHKYAHTVNFEYIHGTDLNKVYKWAEGLNDKGAIAMTDIHFRNDHTPVNPGEIIKKISSISKVPVFDGRETSLGKGIVGGVFNNGVEHGIDAAELTLKFIDRPDYKPKKKLFRKAGKYSFDYNLLHKLNIDFDLLPKHSVIINQPDALKRYYKYILSLIIFTLFQAIIITVLVRNIHLRKKAESRLRTQYNIIQSQNTELEEANETIQETYIKLEKSNTFLKHTITELEEARLEAEQNNSLKTAFLENMSHEVRTPLNGIIGFSELLMKADKTNKSNEYYINFIQKSSDQLLRIIDDILEISNLATKQVSVKNSEFHIEELFDKLSEIHEFKSQETGVPIEIQRTSPNSKTNINSDKLKVQKILNNLLENALKFTHKGKVEIGYSVNSTTITIYIKDTGIGINTKKHKLVFERFTQEQRSISREYGGLGLGLSIAEELTEILGGHITLKSLKNVGSTFYVVLPNVNPKSIQ